MYQESPEKQKQICRAVALNNATLFLAHKTNRIGIKEYEDAINALSDKYTSIYNSLRDEYLHPPRALDDKYGTRCQSIHRRYEAELKLLNDKYRIIEDTVVLETADRFYDWLIAPLEKEEWRKETAERIKAKTCPKTNEVVYVTPEGIKEAEDGKE